MIALRVWATVACFALVGCRTETKPDPRPEPSASTSSASSPSEGVLRLGAPIEAKETPVSLGDIGATPNAFVGRTFVTSGTVTAVCQHRGCWMELVDQGSSAHVKMAGHAFFVPRTASGRKARVFGRLVQAGANDSCEAHDDENGATASGGGGAPGHGKSSCRAEAEKQLGRPLARLALVADGVELL